MPHVMGTDLNFPVVAEVFMMTAIFSSGKLTDRLTGSAFVAKISEKEMLSVIFSFNKSELKTLSISSSLTCSVSSYVVRCVFKRRISFDKPSKANNRTAISTEFSERSATLVFLATSGAKCLAILSTR